ncbi:hypothetical protein RSOLAG1IB_03999 [Rhizoctonia solani AG-1 IB]|uniref:BZIP domain-containing protein n=1 Tax=Thanatephorus cucumeris (strain AG1-IB / isolate 7/3/14) TaxID=1108050 RepID=A0A0B7FSU9_THACB|nr:hypothetical protein RSOLAG1IB_03999 [Rhizoctonia solani AG-1 IB]
MPSSSLQGLNLVHPESPPSNLTDAQDLLATPLFPDLAAHLDLWTNVNFASDEPFISARDRQLKEAETESPRADSLTRKEAAHNFTTPAPSPVLANALPQNNQFDFQRFLAEFGISPPGADALSIQAPPGIPQPDFAQNSFGTSTIQPAQSEVNPAPAPKRARTTKTTSSSISSPTTPSAPESSQAEPDTSTPLTASEDKRRRNTAASARFRLKKKEREAALDAKAHALEERVAGLERECEGLRRENGWLRGLVVGVTGGVVPSMGDVPIAPPSSATTTVSTTGAEKRKRDEQTA